MKSFDLVFFYGFSWLAAAVNREGDDSDDPQVKLLNGMKETSAPF